jgi:hypothetical protein
MADLRLTLAQIPVWPSNLPGSHQPADDEAHSLQSLQSAVGTPVNLSLQLVTSMFRNVWTWRCYQGKLMGAGGAGYPLTRPAQTA